MTARRSVRGLRPPAGRDERWLAGVAGGLLWGWAFNLVLHDLFAPAAPVLSTLGLAGIIWALRGASLGRGAAIGGAAMGLGAAAGLFWLSAVTVPGYVLLCVHFALFGVLFGLASVLLRRSLGSALWVPAVAALWTAIEFARATLFTGFPWMLSGSLVACWPTMLAAAGAGGVYAVSFLVALVAALAVGRRPEGLAARAVMVVALVVLWAGGSRTADLLGAGPAGPTVSVTAVQPLVPFKVGPKADPVAQLREQQALCSGLTPGGTDLLIWSETMVPGDLLEQVGPLLAPLAREKRCWFLAGGVIHERRGPASAAGGRNYNSAVLISPEGRLAGRYDKRRLVPFGEYVPLGGCFPGAARIFDLIGTIFSPGDAEQPLPAMGRVPLGVSICFEDTFPHLARADAERGARLLVNLTNDSWFGRSSEARQHLALAAVRAAETRLPLVRATNTGISALVDSRGRITVPPSGGLWQRGLVRMSPAPGGSERPYYVRAGDTFAWSCAVAVLILVLVGLVRGRRRRDELPGDGELLPPRLAATPPGAPLPGVGAEVLPGDGGQGGQGR
jgi:apolipoprotein N-acyltransferase